MYEPRCVDAQVPRVSAGPGRAGESWSGGGEGQFGDLSRVALPDVDQDHCRDYRDDAEDRRYQEALAGTVRLNGVEGVQRGVVGVGGRRCRLAALCAAEQLGQVVLRRAGQLADLRPAFSLRRAGEGRGEHGEADRTADLLADVEQS